MLKIFQLKVRPSYDLFTQYRTGTGMQREKLHPNVLKQRNYRQFLFLKKRTPPLCQWKKNGGKNTGTSYRHYEKNYFSHAKKYQRGIVEPHQIYAVKIPAPAKEKVRGSASRGSLSKWCPKISKIKS
jgi:hypothetical protein